MRKINMTVAEYITLLIEASNKTQTQIAEECGFEKSNIITMLKKGQTKVPIAKIGALARSLNVDPIHLYATVMREYNPETWEAIEGLAAQPVLTQNELKILDAIRKAKITNSSLNGHDLDELTKTLRQTLPVES